MRCEEVVIELDSYLTAELDSKTTSDIERHLKQCSACNAELLMLRKENSLYQAYRSTVETPADAWDEVQGRMAQPMAEDWKSASRQPPAASRRGGWVWVAAASVLLVASLSLYFYEQRNAPGLGRPRESGRATETQPQMDQVMKDFEQALGLLRAAYTEKKKNLDPGLVSELDRNLELTRMAIDECERALREDPNNGQAVEFLLLGYEKQITILRRITEEL